MIQWITFYSGWIILTINSLLVISHTRQIFYLKRRVSALEPKGK